MKEDAHRQFTVRRVPTAVERALRRKAHAENKSLNDILLDSLVQAAGVTDVEYHDLDDCIGTWEDDPAIERALAAQRTIDRKLWR